jgi:DNA-3-methyladenine glycosylase
MSARFEREFFRQDVLLVAPSLLGKRLVRIGPGVVRKEYIISETEAYRGVEDKACHASRGRTPRTEVMFREGGLLYIYLIYGIHWMMNIVTEGEGIPQAVLIRGLREASGPGRLTRLIGVDRSFYGEDLVTSNRIWIEQCGWDPEYTTGPRVGIDYAGETFRDMPWRFLMIL